MCGVKGCRVAAAGLALGKVGRAVTGEGGGVVDFEGAGMLVADDRGGGEGRIVVAKLHGLGYEAEDG